MCEDKDEPDTNNFLIYIVHKTTQYNIRCISKICIHPLGSLGHC